MEALTRLAHVHGNPAKVAKVAAPGGVHGSRAPPGGRPQVASRRVVIPASDHRDGEPSSIRPMTQPALAAALTAWKYRP